MQRARRRVYLRYAGAGDLFEDFLIAAVAAVLGFRIVLHLTGYPRLAPGSLHIAHMLPGGLAMLAALLLLLGYLGSGVKRVAAVRGGAGFGTFIDELGKFVTKDNDYFFQPTAALIYLVFVLTYLAFRATRRRPLAPEEAVANALEMTLEAVRHDLDREERDRALAWLGRASPGDPIAAALADALRRTEPVPASAPAWPARLKVAARRLYARLVATRWFPGAVVAFFVLHAVLTLAKSVLEVRAFAPVVAVLVVALALGAAGVRAHRRGRRTRAALLYLVGAAVALAAAPTVALETVPRLSFFEWGDLASSAAPGVLVLVGVFRMRISRLDAYRWFQRAVLVALFVTQFFAFYHAQFVAAAGLVWNLLIFATLRYAIGREESRAAG